MRRHTEAEASVLFGKPTSPCSSSTPAPLSKGGVLYGPMYLDEINKKVTLNGNNKGSRRRRALKEWTNSRQSRH